MIKLLSRYLYAVFGVLMLCGVFYIGYVFYDRDEAKRTVAKQQSTIEAQNTEIRTKAIAAKAKGNIEQIEKETVHEADDTFGIHTFNF